MTETNRATFTKRIIFTSLGIGVLAALVYGLLRRWRLRSVSAVNGQALEFKPSERGLSEAEAAERHTDERAQTRLLAEQRARRERRKRNTFSIFNLTMLVFAISQLLLRDPLGAAATIGTLILNIAINIFQETRSARQVGELANQARPLATVIRDGRLRSIDQDEVVVGDVLVAGRGDEFLADGLLLESANLTIDESGLEEQAVINTKKPGEPVCVGSYCTSGWAVYRVEKINIETPGNKKQIKATTPARSMTPLQIIVERVLYVLLVIVGIFYITLALEVIRADMLQPDTLELYRGVMSIIFTLAPGGLFFMIVITYAVGSADIARTNTLVRNNLTIESLAQVSTLCMIRRGGATGVNFQLEMIPSLSESPVLPESRVNQVLGNYVHSIQGDKFPLTILKDGLEGETRPIHQQARYLSIYGWEAATFTSADMPGSYVLGDPEVLHPYLLEPEAATTGEGRNPSEKDGQNGIGGRLRKWLGGRRSNSQASDERLPEPSTPAEAGNVLPASADQAKDRPKRLGVLRGFGSRLISLARRGEAGKEQNDQLPDEDQNKEILRLMFAYSPLMQPIYDDAHLPQCPQELVPVCFVRFVEEVRPEVQKAVQTFMDAGVAIKVLADEEPTQALVTAQQLGLIETGPDKIPVTTGDEISQSTTDQLGEAARENLIFAQLTSEQMNRILDALQDQGEYVAVLGSSIADLRVMRKANLSITRRGSSPSVLDNADIILLKNSPGALPEVLQKGQRIVNGLMDVLKLNLTQISYILILLVAMFVTGGRVFYYHPTQGGATGIFTVVIPSIFLSLWASGIKVKRSSMHLQLIHFIAPAAAMMAFTVLVIYSIFLGTGVGILYTQQTVTHSLVLMGLLLVVFVQPPVRFLAGGDENSGDWRPTYVAVVLFLIFQIATHIPIVQRLLMLAPLRSWQDYLLVWGISIIWAILTLGLWRLNWLKRGLDRSSRWMLASAE